MKPISFTRQDMSAIKLQSTTRHGARWLSVDQPSKRNALSLDVVEQLIVALDAAERAPTVHSIVITGTGKRVFASGADLDELPEAFSSPQSAQAYDLTFDHLYAAIYNCRKPVIARINGHAIGGGLLLALACDLRICTEEAKLGFPVAKIGLMLSPTEHRLILSAISRSAAKHLLFGAHLIDAQAAGTLGLIDEITSSADLDTKVDELTDAIAQGAPLAIAAAKSLLNHLGDRSESTMSVIANAYELIYSSSDLKEGLEAIQSKRKPEFSGT